MAAWDASMVMQLASLKSYFAMVVCSSSALVMYKSMMPSSFIFAIYFVNFAWRRRAALILNLLWCLIRLLVLVVVFVLSSAGGGLRSADNYANFAYALLKCT